MIVIRRLTVRLPRSQLPRGEMIVREALAQLHADRTTATPSRLVVHVETRPGTAAGVARRIAQATTAMMRGKDR